MAFWDKVRNNNQLFDDEGENEEFNDYEEGYDEEEEEEDEFEEPAPRAVDPAPQTGSARRQTYASAPRSETAASNRVLNIHATAQLQVVIRKPESLEDAREIADHLLERHTVVVNLESTNRETGRRILDFLGGVSYANHGALTKVANATFVVTPYNVGLIGQDVLTEVENSGVFFG